MRKEDAIASVNPYFSKEIATKSEMKSELKQREENTLKTGTTTVGLVCTDAVVLGTDKRASMGYFVASKTSEKVHKIQEHLYMTIAGSVADAQYLVNILRAQTTLYQLEHDGKPIPVKSAGKMLANILYYHKMFPYEVGLILGGITEEEGPILLDLDAYGSLLPDKFTAIGSGQNYSLGVLESKYKEGLTAEEGKAIVKTAVKASISRDIGSGNGIDIVVVKKEGAAEREFIPM